MKRFWKLIIIVLFAGLLRFFQLTQVPPSLYWDEVSQGYNAHSILISGRDEHNELLPLARFKAFGDYKAPIYIYLDVVAQAVFGKNEFAVRFPSAFFGTLSVFVAYFLAKELFKKSEQKERIALFAAFFLAVSPWHIQLSRAAFEANIATLFTLSAVWAFLKSMSGNRRFLFLSTILFVLAFYSFNAHRIFIPLLVLLLIVIYKDTLRETKKITAVAVFVGVILLIPFIVYFVTPESRLRFKEVNIFSDLDVIRSSNQYIEEDDYSLIGKVVHNRRVLFAEEYLRHYFDFFNPRYLFFTGDGNPRFSLQENGQLFVWMLPLILTGVYVLAKRPDTSTFLLFSLFLLAPVAAATARETPHALRTETFIPTYEVFGAVGLSFFVEIVRRFSKKALIAGTVLFCCVVVFSITSFLHNYFIHYPYIYSGVWQYGYKETIQKVEKIKHRYDSVAFTDAYGRAYIYILWYGNISPQTYWQKGKVTRDAFGFYTVSHVDTYEIRTSLNKTEDEGKSILYVAAPGELSFPHKVLDSVKFLNGETAFVIAEKTE